MDGDGQNERESGPFGWFVGLVLSAVVVGGIADLVLDAPTRPSAHVGLEITLILLSFGGVLYLALGWTSARRALATAHRDLSAKRAERDAWRASAEKVLEGLSREVTRQFDAWSLTRAEQEVGLRLLKGQSLKRIARETDRSERTIRQHAVAVYRKSGMSGRAELSGFFLGELPLPEPPAIDPT